MSWIPALFGLLGVFIGGIITAGSNYLLDRRRERAASERDARNQAIEFKTAARLMDAELVRAYEAARMVIRDKRWFIPETKLKTDVWQTYSPHPSLSAVIPRVGYGEERPLSD